MVSDQQQQTNGTAEELSRSYSCIFIFLYMWVEELGDSDLLYSFPLLGKKLDAYAYEYCL